MWSTLQFALSLIPIVSLSRERERLQQILKEKKNRKWSILEALKDVLASLGTRFRRGTKSGVHLEKLVEQMENHEVGRGTLQ